MWNTRSLPLRVHVLTLGLQLPGGWSNRGVTSVVEPSISYDITTYVTVDSNGFPISREAL